MRFRLDLVLKPAEGALLRVLGMVERRGFRTVAIDGRPAAADAGRWHLRLEVEGQRPGESLRHQLEKIYDCESVQVTELPTIATEAAA